MQRILLSIRPKYTKEIFKGTKKFELRKNVPSEIKEILVYETSPTSKIVGKLFVKKIHCLPKDEIYELTKNDISISKEEFFNYFKNYSQAYAIEIEEYEKFKEPINLKIIDVSKPPQNYIFISDEDNIKINKEKKFTLPEDPNLIEVSKEYFESFEKN